MARPPKRCASSLRGPRRVGIASLVLFSLLSRPAMAQWAAERYFSPYEARIRAADAHGADVLVGTSRGVVEWSRDDGVVWHRMTLGEPDKSNVVGTRSSDLNNWVELPILRDPVSYELFGVWNFERVRVTWITLFFALRPSFLWRAYRPELIFDTSNVSMRGEGDASFRPDEVRDVALCPDGAFAVTAKSAYALDLSARRAHPLFTYPEANLTGIACGQPSYAYGGRRLTALDRDRRSALAPIPIRGMQPKKNSAHWVWGDGGLYHQGARGWQRVPGPGPATRAPSYTVAEDGRLHAELGGQRYRWQSGAWERTDPITARGPTPPANTQAAGASRRSHWRFDAQRLYRHPRAGAPRNAPQSPTARADKRWARARLRRTRNPEDLAHAALARADLTPDRDRDLDRRSVLRAYVPQMHALYQYGQTDGLRFTETIVTAPTRGRAAYGTRAPAFLLTFTWDLRMLSFQPSTAPTNERWQRRKAQRFQRKHRKYLRDRVRTLWWTRHRQLERLAAGRAPMPEQRAWLKEHIRNTETELEALSGTAVLVPAPTGGVQG